MSRADEATRLETQAQMEAALDELAKLFEVIHKWQLEGVTVPTELRVDPRSPLARDDRDTAPYHMSHMVILSLGVAVDHLHALRAVIQQAGSLHLYAPYTMVRAAIEAASTVLYLLGESSRAERVRRRLMLVAQDHRDRNNFLTEMGEPLEPTLEKRIMKLKAVAARTPAIDPNAIGGTPPAFTTIVRKGGEASQLGAEATLGGWQMCSGLAHGRQWASFAFSDRDRVREMTSDVLEVRLTSSATTINIVTQCAFLLTYEARELFQRQCMAP